MGARPYLPITSAISSAELADKSISIAHPYPQIFKGKGVTLLATDTKVYTVDESTWTLTQITTYDMYDQGTPKSISAGGGPWQFIDFHTTWFLVKAGSVVIQTSWNSSKVFVEETVTTTTGCDWRGRMLLGGFDSTDYWSAAWQTQWASWYTKGAGYGYTIGAPESNWIWWSSIGGGDLLHLYDPTMAVTGVNEASGITLSGHDSDSPIALDYARRSEAGFMPMDWQGTVQCLKPMKDVVMVYGTDGISAVKAYPEPVPTFGLEEHLLRIGIASRTAVGGDYRQHVFVDNTGVLWSVAQNLQMTRLGYEEFLSPMLGNEITVVHDPSRNYFYISDNTSGYVLTDTGFAETPQLVTSGFQAEGALVGISGDGSETADATIIFDMLDRSLREPQTLEEVDFSLTDTDGLNVTVYYRYDKSQAFSTVTQEALDKTGRLRVLATGIDFRVRIDSADYTALSLDNVVLRFKEGGKVDLRRRLA
jgi:hypothetical protein